jgi:hypothetical protein
MIVDPKTNPLRVPFPNPADRQAATGCQTQLTPK